MNGVVDRLRARAELNLAWDKWELGDKPVPQPLLHAETARYLFEAADLIERLEAERDMAKEGVSRLSAQLAKTFGIEKLGWLDHWRSRAEAAEAQLAALASPPDTVKRGEGV